MDKMDLGKKIFFQNYGCVIFMKANGEYEEYIKCNISQKQEGDWKKQIKQDLINKIINSNDLNLIWNLSCMEIEKEEKKQAFKFISQNGNTDEILKKIYKLRNLFDPETYNMLLSIFSK